MAHAPGFPAWPANVPPFFKALADDTRLAILGYLLRSDMRGQELVERLGQPQNAVSYHLKMLKRLGLLRNRRSSGDARDIYYSVDLPALEALYAAVGTAFWLREPDSAGTDLLCSSSTAPLRILYVCTQNSARSQLAEALTRQRGGERVDVASAGTTPTSVHPLTHELLTEHGIDPSHHVAKALDPFVGQPFDYIITVCDRARDQCPSFSEESAAIHWSIPDPVAPPNPADRQAAFRDVWQELEVRIDHLLRLPAPDSGPHHLSPALPVTA
jgi:protein-tyrosine-phosphatase/DNA-binding transcriptional ArsR family regulator